MDKHDIDVKNLYPDVYAKVAQIIKELHDPVTGFHGLRHSIKSKLSSELSADKMEALKTNKNLEYYIINIVLHKINEFETAERPGPELTNEQRNKFETSVLNEIKVLLQHPKEYAKTHSLEDLDPMKFSLSAENIIKYRFYVSCGNAADAFAYKNEQLGQNRMPLTFLHSTRWNHLMDGMVGHTIPRIQLPDGKYVALDPQTRDVKFITSEMKVGNKIYHLLPGHKGIPYMITEIRDTNYNNFGDFIKNASKVPYNKAIEFLETISDDVDAGELNEYKEKISQAYREQMKLATADIKQLGQNTENQSLKSLVYTNKKQND